MTSREIKEKVNEGFVTGATGCESKSTAISVPECDFQAKVHRENTANTNMLKLAVVFIVILTVGIVVIGVYYVKEVRDNEDEDGIVHKSPTTTKLLAGSAPTTTKFPATTSPPCIDENCIQNAAGKRGNTIILFRQNFSF